jgi:hypothetical protein
MVLENVLDEKTLFFKIPLVGTPNAEWYKKRSFPHKGDSG